MLNNNNQDVCSIYHFVHRNSLSLNMLYELTIKLKVMAADHNVRALIIAAKPPVFSAGHNLKELVCLLIIWLFIVAACISLSNL